MDSDTMKIIVSIIGGIVTLAVGVAAIAAMIIVFAPPKRTPEQKKKARKRSALNAKCVLVKIAIWVGTFLAANLFDVLLGYLIRGTSPSDSIFAGVGIPGAIPKMIFWAAAFFVARKLSKTYEKHFQSNYGKYFEEDDGENEEAPKKDIPVSQEETANTASPKVQTVGENDISANNSTAQ